MSGGNAIDIGEVARRFLIRLLHNAMRRYNLVPFMRMAVRYRLVLFSRARDSGFGGDDRLGGYGPGHGLGWCDSRFGNRLGGSRRRCAIALRGTYLGERTVRQAHQAIGQGFAKQLVPFVLISTEN